MSNGTCDLTPTSAMVPAYRDAYNQTIRHIEADLRRGIVPDFDGEIARLQSEVLKGGPDVSGRMAAYADYRSIVTGQCGAPSGHPLLRFTAQTGTATASVGSHSYPTMDVTLDVTEGRRTRSTVLTGVIDASRLSEADRDSLSSNPNYMERRLQITDRSAGGNGMIREITVYIPVARHPVERARRPLLARTDN